MSIDGGARWVRMKGNMPSVPVHDLLVHPARARSRRGHLRPGDLHHDVSVLQQLDEKVLAEDIHVFDIDPESLFQTSGWGNYDFYGDRHLTTPNEPNALSITYYLRDARDRKVTVTVADLSNRLVRTLTGTVAAGPQHRSLGHARRRREAAAARRLPGDGRDRRPEVREDRAHQAPGLMADAWPADRCPSCPAATSRRRWRSAAGRGSRTASAGSAARRSWATCGTSRAEAAGDRPARHARLDARRRRPATCSDEVARVLDARGDGATLTERLGRDVWIDFVADTGDDSDVSAAVAGMVFAEYALQDGSGRVLPRGDLLIFGGDTAYPLSSAPEIARRLTHPWNQVLAGLGPPARARVLLAIPGNHDWYDGLDGFARLFRRDPLRDRADRGDDPELLEQLRLAESADPRESGRALGRIYHQLHFDEVAGSLKLAEQALAEAYAVLTGRKVKRISRLWLIGYRAVQEASYWLLPLAPGLDLWGVDRHLRSMDFRQRLFFDERRAARPGARRILVSPDPAIAMGEPNAPGAADPQGVRAVAQVGPDLLPDRRQPSLRAPPRSARRCTSSPAAEGRSSTAPGCTATRAGRRPRARFPTRRRAAASRPACRSAWCSAPAACCRTRDAPHSRRCSSRMFAHRRVRGLG